MKEFTRGYIENKVNEARQLKRKIMESKNVHITARIGAAVATAVAAVAGAQMADKFLPQGAMEPTNTPNSTEVVPGPEGLNPNTVAKAVENWDNFTIQGHLIERTGKIVLPVNDPNSVDSPLFTLNLDEKEYTLAGVTLKADDGKDYPSLMLVNHDKQTGTVEANLLQPITTEGLQTTYDVAELDATGQEAYLADYKFVIENPAGEPFFYILGVDGKKQLVNPPQWPNATDDIYNAVYKINIPVALTQAVVPTSVPTETLNSVPTEVVGDLAYWQKTISGDIKMENGFKLNADYIWETNTVLTRDGIENSKGPFVVLGKGEIIQGIKQPEALLAFDNGATVLTPSDNPRYKGDLVDHGRENVWSSTGHMLLSVALSHNLSVSYDEFEGGDNFALTIEFSELDLYKSVIKELPPYFLIEDESYTWISPEKLGIDGSSTVADLVEKMDASGAHSITIFPNKKSVPFTQP